MIFRRVYLFLFLLLPNCKKNGNVKTIEINGNKVKVEIADTPGERLLGLQGRDTLPPNYGMLFVFPDEKRREFWMFRCKFDIDLAYIDASGIIREIITMKKEPPIRPIDSLKSYPSHSSRIKFALETMGGWFLANGVRVGTQIDLRRFYALY